MSSMLAEAPHYYMVTRLITVGLSVQFVSMPYADNAMHTEGLIRLHAKGNVSWLIWWHSQLQGRHTLTPTKPQRCCAGSSMSNNSWQDSTSIASAAYDLSSVRQSRRSQMQPAASGWAAAKHSRCNPQRWIALHTQPESGATCCLHTVLSQTAVAVMSACLLQLICMRSHWDTHAARHQAMLHPSGVVSYRL